MSDPPISFRRARAGTQATVCLAGLVDDAFRAGTDTAPPLTRILQCSLSHGVEWYTRDVGHYVTAICRYVRPESGKQIFASVSAEGDVLLQANPEVVEKIATAGMDVERPPLHGKTYGIQQIGQGLFVCGEGGQFYQRDASGTWAFVDPRITVDSSAIHARMNERNARSTAKTIRERNEEDRRRPEVEQRAEKADMDEIIYGGRRKSFHGINGSSAQDIYLTGYDGALLHWDGFQGQWVAGLPKTQLFGIHVEHEGAVWVCGSEGTLLRGNARSGFQDLSPGGELSFNTLTQFNGRLYLTTNSGFGGPVGLWTFHNGRLDPVSTGLSPDIHDIHTVDCDDGLLWAVGFKDILCFDGTTWGRVDYPDNPPVRSP